MGQTLNHGVYLPAEGERNCYAGLASNWNLLDTAIGDIAGKASATHTHGNITNDGKVGTTANLPLITGTGGAVQAGSFGTSANTFCEGNDSRLSDARTPVAHTHGKTDVTDLLNSNFIPSANNSYDLGSSSYQWNNLYAKNYFYNGVAWGLDKVNTWTGDNTFSAANLFRKIAFTLGDNSSQIVRMEYKDKNNSRWGILSFIQDTNNTVHCDIGVHALKTDGQTVLNKSVTLLVRPDNSSEFKPINDKAIDLGTSTNKWKSLNGINPGALSLPNLDSTQYDPIDFSQWNVSLGWGNYYTPQSDGWIHVNIKDSTDCSVFVFASNSNPMYAASAYGNGSQGLTGRVALMMPVRAGITYTFMVKASATSDIYSVIFIPALGNV